MRAENLKDLQREKQTFTVRVIVAALACALMIGLLLYRLVDLQVLQQDYFSSRADENRRRLLPVAPVRGLIYDRNGLLLAENSPAFVLELTPEKIRDIGDTVQRLGALIHIEDTDIARFEKQRRKTPSYRGVPLRSNLSLTEVARFELNRFDFPGVDISAGLSRNYPLGTVTAHVIGYVSSINEKELQEIDPQQYEGLTQIGKVGIEKSYEDVLRGSPGARIIEANAFGRPLRELESRPGEGGRNLILTLDAQIQKTAVAALGELDGAVVAIDPRNGELLAMVSKPGFDPELFMRGIDSKTYKALLEDPRRPLYNRALQGTYPPGSTIKPFMALAGLANDVVTASHTEFCGGSMSLPGSSRRYRCWRRQGHGTLTLGGAVMHSCDVYFYQLARLLGVDRIHDFLSAFGLGDVTHVDLPLERRGVLPSSAWKRQTYNQPWYPGETLSYGIGQGYLTVTAMQLAQITARLAMRGGGYQPHLLKALQDPLTGEEFPTPTLALPPIDNHPTDDWEAVIDAMEAVAHTPGATAYRVFGDAPYRVAGKTGTAQVASLSQTDKPLHYTQVPYKLRDHGLFIAFAPADNPEIALAVIAEHGGSGSGVAGPIARKVLDQYFLGEVRYNVPAPSITEPTPPAPRAAPATAETPQ